MPLECRAIRRQHSWVFCCFYVRHILMFSANILCSQVELVLFPVPRHFGVPSLEPHRLLLYVIHTFQKPQQHVFLLGSVPSTTCPSSGDPASLHFVSYDMIRFPTIITFLYLNRQLHIITNFSSYQFHATVGMNHTSCENCTSSPIEIPGHTRPICSNLDHS